MKKGLIVLLICLFLLVGCGDTKTNDNLEDDLSSIESNETTINDDGLKIIKDNVFIQMTNDMYLNAKNYKDQKLQIEGLMYIDEWEGETHLYIIRRTPGCCGNDGLAGLEVYYDGELPDEDTWVVGKGIWEKSETADSGWLLVLYSLEIKEEKGNEFLEYNY